MQTKWLGLQAACIAGLVLLIQCTGKKGVEVPDKPTFTEHIAPIIFKHCSSCHRENGIAPFALTNYKEVRRKLKTIAKVTRLKIMPPWPADATYSHFVGENYLTPAEIETIAKWAQQGGAEGPADKLPVYTPPAWRSNIGKPDLVLALDTVSLFPDMRDRFFLMKIAGQIPNDTWVRAVEFIPGTPDLVHHFNGHLVMYEPGSKKNVFDGFKKVELTKGEYAQDFSLLKLENDDGSYPYRVHSVVNYLPGVVGNAYPEGIGTFKLFKLFAFTGNDVHYGPSDRKQIDKSYLNIFFTNKPPERELGELMLGTNGVSKIEPPLVIQPNTVSKHSTRFVVPKDISILTINPHLHMLGKRFLAYALKPNGDTIPLIRILNWDFRWQYFYTFTHMVPVPKGSVIVAEAEFDNTAANPNNPNQPPKVVGERLEYGGASMRAADEMFQFIITYTLFQQGDEQVKLSR